jgi:hypothetical protein
MPDITDESILSNSNRISESFIHLPKIYSLFTDDQLVIYIEKFFKLFFQEYKIIIETNFYQIKDLFPLYSKLPVHYYIELCTNQSFGNWEITRGIKNVNTDKNHVEVIINSTETKFVDHSEIQAWTSQMLEPFFNRTSKTLSGVDLNELCPLRGFLYRKLNDEIKEVIERLKNS